MKKLACVLLVIIVIQPVLADDMEVWESMDEGDKIAFLMGAAIGFRAVYKLLAVADGEYSLKAMIEQLDKLFDATYPDEPDNLVATVGIMLRRARDAGQDEYKLEYAYLEALIFLSSPPATSKP